MFPGCLFGGVTLMLHSNHRNHELNIAVDTDLQAPSGTGTLWSGRESLQNVLVWRSLERSLSTQLLEEGHVSIQQ